MAQATTRAPLSYWGIAADGAIRSRIQRKVPRIVETIAASPPVFALEREALLAGLGFPDAGEFLADLGDDPLLLRGGDFAHEPLLPPVRVRELDLMVTRREPSATASAGDSGGRYRAQCTIPWLPNSRAGVEDARHGLRVFGTLTSCALRTALYDGAYTLRSRRPGRSRAGSRVSHRLVAMITCAPAPSRTV